MTPRSLPWSSRMSRKRHRSDLDSGDGRVPPNLLQLSDPRQDLNVIGNAPAGIIIDALTIAVIASPAILIVEAGKHQSVTGRRGTNAMREVGANVIGVTVNKMSSRVGVSYYSRIGYARYVARAQKVGTVAVPGDRIAGEALGNSHDVL